MKVLNETPFQFAPLVGKVRHPDPTLTLVVKGTFGLGDGSAIETAEEQLLPTGDEFVDDDEERGVRYPSDFAYYKPNADLMLVGSCRTPGGEPLRACKVTFRVGTHERSLYIQGDCAWKRKLGMSVPGEPEPFTVMDVGWVNAYGGPGNEWNSAGKGIDAVECDDGSRRIPVPNVQDIDRLVTSRSSRLRPAGFGPVRNDWKPRRDKQGTYKGRWTKERWPYLPDDFDWTYFNSAPEMMQYQGYLNGVEELFLANLVEGAPEYRSALPGHRVRCFLDEKHEDGGTGLREVAMNLDTLWIDVDAGRLVLVWRGIQAVRDEDLADYENVLILDDPVGGVLRSIEECEQARDVLLSNDDEGPPPRTGNDLSLEEEMARQEAELRHQITGAGVNLAEAEEAAGEPDPERDAEVARKFSEEHDIPEEDLVSLFAPPVTISQLLERFAAGETFSGENLAGLNCSRCNLAGIVLEGAQLSGTDLSGADLTGANLKGAILRDADMRETRLDGADLTGAYMSGACLEKSVLVGSILDGAMISETRMAGAVLSRSSAREADFTGSDLRGADLEQVAWEGCEIVSADLRDAIFTRASLVNCDFSDSRGETSGFKEADLNGARFTGGACFAGASFTDVHAPESTWEGATLSEADFSGSQLTRADFTNSSLQGADFTLARMRKTVMDRADLRDAVLREADLFRGSFEKADLTGADMRGSNLYEAEFLDAVLDDADLENAIVKMTKLE